ncbi:urease subunit alpha, partial [Kitasatospora sp. NPDC056789]
MSSSIDASEYTAVHGPRAGDRVRLGDSGLVVRVESDSQRPGDEFLAGFGKTARDGLHLKAAAVRDTCDVVISNVLVIDAIQGIRKTSIGIREGRIASIGRAGNPDTLDGVDVVVGTGTAIVSGEGLIVTAGAIDTHVHLMSPRIMEASLASGVTTIIGQEFGPVWGVGVNSPWALRHAFNSFDAWPVNIGFLGRGSSSHPAPLVEALAEGGACGFKVHEDMGAHTRALDTALSVAEAHDVQVALHTDGLNECLSVEDTLKVLEGRTIHAFHIEGCGGGHVPNVLKMAGVPNVIGSSTNPTLPFGRDAVAEHYGMIVSVHGLKTDLPGDAAMARDRIRAGTMGAEDVLHDLGAIGITSSDAQGMGRAGETVRRTFAVAGKMKAERGPLEGDGPDDDNQRVLRYIAKLTINPAIAHGLSH